MISTLPAWLRWMLLIPLSLAGGFIVGCGAYLIYSSEAARPDAPIVFIAEFAGKLASNLAAFYIAHEVAPSYKKRIVAILIIIIAFASLGAGYTALQRGEPRELFWICGSLSGCVIGWLKHVRPNRD